MFIYTKCVLENEDGEKKLAPLALHKELIATFRGFVDDTDMKAPFQRHAAIGFKDGTEWFVTSTFDELKKQIDPNSDDGGVSRTPDIPRPVLDVGQ
jgi:hypothetical protein